tara:strand:- start:418 stop:2613 length:2196 start_codon:yes stop_codon:yes gene_type:complete
MYNWVIKRKNLSGEMYDLTASSTIGLKGFETGRLKNTQALMHGISESLEKYKLELDIILKDETDDKAEKRKEIGYIIDNCMSCDKLINDLIPLNINGSNEKLTNWSTIQNHPPSFDELFKFTMNYLNGGNGSNQFEKQPLIITIVGGNPLKIFFAILTYLHNLEKDEDIDSLVNDIITKFYKGVNEPRQKDILENILKNLKIFLNFNIIESEKETFTGEEHNLITELDFNLFLIKNELNKRITQKLQFSDMDFALVPNENTELDKIYLQKGGVGPKKQKITQESVVKNVSLPLPSSGRITRSQAPPGEIPKKRDLTYQKEEEKEEEKKREKKQKKAEAGPSSKPSTKTAKKGKTSPKGPTPSKGRKSAKAGPSQMSKVSKEKKSHGFLLVRLKSANQFQQPYDGVPEYIKTTLKQINELSELNPNGANACSNPNDLKLLGKTLKYLSQPQLFRQSYLNFPGVSENCTTFIKYLEQSKNLIGNLTSMNISTFVDYLSGDGDDKVRLAAFMDFLHENGEIQNILIKTLFDGDGSKLRDKGEICRQYLNKEEVIFNFESIESICDTTKPLFKVMSELVLEFSKRKQVKEVMKIITKKLAGNIEATPNKSFTFDNCKYNNIYVSPHLAYELDKGNQSLRSIKSDASDLPPNSKISSNPTYKPTNLESKKIKSGEEKALEKAIEREIDNLIAEEYIEKNLISDFSKLKIAKGGKKTRKKKNKISRRKKYTKKNKKG